LAVGIDAKDGRVAVKGWVETMELSALDLAREALNTGIRTIIYTDIATDGMLQGPNIAAMREMASEVPCDLIASGGVSGPEDVRQLAGVSGLHGVIIGRALYERRMPEDLRTILG
jgi:phosphoribosylformimino-5-aminoimidazole carboxamide ribotide isomerase